MIDDNRLILLGATLCAGTVVVLLFTDAALTLNTFDAWCQAHNGTLHADSTLYCELPNGTTVGPQEVDI
jgi:hypothetical protein